MENGIQQKMCIEVVVSDRSPRPYSGWQTGWLILDLGSGMIKGNESLDADPIGYLVTEL